VAAAVTRLPPHAGGHRRRDTTGPSVRPPAEQQPRRVRRTREREVQKKPRSDDCCAVLISLNFRDDQNQRLTISNQTAISIIFELKGQPKPQSILAPCTHKPQSARESIVGQAETDQGTCRGERMCSSCRVSLIGLEKLPPLALVPPSLTTTGT
jgi:hypothetical protein